MTLLTLFFVAVTTITLLTLFFVAVTTITLFPHVKLICKDYV